MKTKKFAKNRKKDAIVANLQLFKQNHLFSWTQLAPKVKAIRSHKNSFLHEKSHRKKKEKNFSSRKQKLKLIRRLHGVVSLSLSLAFERTGTNKLREGQLVFNFFNFPSLFLSFKFTFFPILNFCFVFSDTNSLHYFLATEYHLGKCPISMIA